MPEVTGRERFAASWRRVHARLHELGADDVTVVAVTKGFSHDVVGDATAAGALDLGENYAQELVAKAERWASEHPVPTTGDPRWHFIGQLQRNKVRRLAPHVALWQSVDRVELGREIARWAPEAPVLVQVDISDEPAKGGSSPAEVPALVASLRDLGLDVRGLMGVAPHGGPEAARQPFLRLVGLADDLALPVRSIGMSGDYEVAVAAGATMLRLGTALFGPRPPRSVRVPRGTQDSRDESGHEVG